MTIHREGIEVISIVAIISIIIVLILVKVITRHKTIIVGSTCVIFVLFMGFILYFFRNPYREINVQANGIISPADGRIVEIKEIFDGEYFNCKCTKISIFMSPLNVHVNRSPVSGVLCYYKYHPGKYLVAFHEKSSELNEHNTIVVKTANNTSVMFRQIAGFVARRIVFYPKINDTLKQGEEVGMIRFGSRVDIIFPVSTNVNIKVKINDKTVAGETLIAQLENHSKK
jgi:phosphatidylserine decarboxylase